jgi:hypothetical protein
VWLFERERKKRAGEERERESKRRLLAHYTAKESTGEIAAQQQRCLEEAAELGC